MLRIGARARRVLVVTAVGAVGAVGLAACGGGSSGSSSDSTTTTEAEPTGALDPSAKAKDAATATGVTQEDLGGEWAQFRKAGGFAKAGKGSCITDFDSGIVASDEGYSGPMFRDTSETAFIYTTAWVFRTEAGAQAFTAVVRGPDYLKCREAESDAAQKKVDPKTFVRMTKTSDPAVGSGGLEAYYVQEPGGTDADGNEYMSGTYSRYIYRSGRVVYVIQIDVGVPANDAAFNALTARTNQAVENVRAAIETRVQALDL